MKTTHFVASPEGVSEFDTEGERDAEFPTRDDPRWITVMLSNGDVHEYSGTQGEGFSGLVQPNGVLEIPKLNRIYSPSGWAFADGNVDNRGRELSSLERRLRGGA